MVRGVRLLIACVSTLLFLSSFSGSPDLSSSSSHSHWQLNLLPTIQFADAQIVHEAMSELERARVDASRSGRVRDLSTLAKRKRHRSSSSSSSPPDHEQALPAPLHVRITEKGEQELYTPDREHHIRTARHPTASGRRRNNHRGRQQQDPMHDNSGPVAANSRGFEGSIHVPRSAKGRLGRKALPTKRDHTEATPLAADAHHDVAHSGENYVQREDSYTLNRQQSANLNTLPMGEEGRVFDQGSLTEQQLSALSALDGGEDHRKAGDGYLASVVDAIIDPHSISVNSSPSSALGIALIVIIPLVAIIVLFFGYSFYIYNKRVALEAKVNSKAKSINAARAAKKAAGGSPTTSPNAEGAPGGPPATNASKKSSVQQRNGGASEEADWEVHYGGRDEEDDL